MRHLLIKQYKSYTASLIMLLKCIVY